MRFVLPVLTVVACGGGGGSSPDAPPIDAPPDIAPDADTSVTGTWVDTYYPTSGAVMTPACTSAPVAIVVNPNNGVYDSYPGTCHADGSFTVATPPGVTDYYLRVAGGLYAMTARGGLMLGTDHLGRSDAAGISGVELSLNLYGMQPWALGDVIMVWSENVGFYESLVFDSNAPNVSDTTLTGTAPWYGDQLVAAKSDVLQVFQLGKHTSASLGYVTLDRAYTAAPFTMLAIATSHIPSAGMDTFVTPSASTMHISIDVPSWDGFASQVTPNTTTHTIAANIFAAVSPDVLPSPPLFSYSQDSSTLGAIDFGTVSFTDPFPAAWQRRIRVSETFSTDYMFNGATGSLNAVMQEIVPLSAAEAGTIAATVGPPRNITIDGGGFFTSTFVNQAPVVAWDAPTLGTPTDYEVTVYEAHVNATQLTFSTTLRLVTKATSVKLPAGYLLGQRQYVFKVTSHSRLGVDVGLTPQHGGGRAISAEVLSSLVTTNF
jgi:hypothetical protein